jgi:hypothetical protein
MAHRTQAVLGRTTLFSAIAVSCLILAGCGLSPDDGQAESSGAATDAAAGVIADASEDEAADVRAAMSSPLGEGREPVSCETEIGSTPSRQFAQQCRRVSPATHPPCNVANSCAMIRSEIARGCAMMGQEAADDPACGGDPYGIGTAIAAIERYYSAINNRDYQTAYLTWDNNGKDSGKTIEDFASGFAQTRSSRVVIDDPGAIEGAAGSLYVTLPVTVEAITGAGEIQRFTGRYVLRQPNVGIAVSQGWHIQSAALKPVS